MVINETNRPNPLVTPQTFHSWEEERMGDFGMYRAFLAFSDRWDETSSGRCALSLLVIYHDLHWRGCTASTASNASHEGAFRSSFKVLLSYGSIFHTKKSGQKYLGKQLRRKYQNKQISEKRLRKKDMEETFGKNTWKDKEWASIRRWLFAIGSPFFLDLSGDQWMSF